MSYYERFMLAVVAFWSLIASIAIMVITEKLSSVEAKTIRAFYRVDARLEALQKCRD